MIEVWLSKKEALEYYGISDTTLQKWSKQGRFSVKETVHVGKRKMNMYLKDEKLKTFIETTKAFDKRFK